LVTIDDLEALHQQLQGDNATTVVNFEFSGGDFDSPADLRQLSDAELQRIVAKTPEVEVVLSIERAEVIGQSNTVESVYEEWARARQTTRKPAGWLRARMLNDVLVLTGFIVVILVESYINTGGFTRFDKVDIFFICLLTLCVAAGIVSAVVTARNKIRSCAVIVPMSNDQFRDQQLEMRRTSRTTWAGIVGAIIGALATVIVALITLK
jgi:hypothetical protein